MAEKDDEKPDYMNEYSKYSSLFFQMMAIVAVGVLGGIELDKVLNTKSRIFTIILTIFTSFLAIYYLFKTLLKK
jgi:F0F1-type ATP synthase assembly protein I